MPVTRLVVDVTINVDYQPQTVVMGVGMYIVRTDSIVVVPREELTDYLSLCIEFPQGLGTRFI